MGVRSAKVGGQHYLGYKIEQSQCFHNAFCLSFHVPVARGAT